MNAPCSRFAPTDPLFPTHHGLANSGLAACARIAGESADALCDPACGGSMWQLDRGLQVKKASARAQAAGGAGGARKG